MKYENIHLTASQSRSGSGHVRPTWRKSIVPVTISVRIPARWRCFRGTPPCTRRVSLFRRLQGYKYGGGSLKCKQFCAAITRVPIVIVIVITRKSHCRRTTDTYCSGLFDNNTVRVYILSPGFRHHGTPRLRALAPSPPRPPHPNVLSRAPGGRPVPQQ